MAENDARIIQIISLRGMDAADLLGGIGGIDPVLVYTVPFKFHLADFYVMRGTAFADPFPCIAGDDSAESVFLLPLIEQGDHIGK